MKHLQLTAAVIYSYFASVIESLALFCIVFKQKGGEGKERADHFLEFDLFIKSLFTKCSRIGASCQVGRTIAAGVGARRTMPFNYDAVSVS